MNGSMDLLVSLLGMAAIRLPLLITLAISVVWVVDTPRGTVRNVALWALAILALSTMVGLLLNFLPLYLLEQGAIDARALSAWLGAGHFALGLVEAVGMVLLVWAMTRALRNRNAPPAP